MTNETTNPTTDDGDTVPATALQAVVVDRARARLLMEVAAERVRQLARWGVQRRADDTGGDALRRAADVARVTCQGAQKHAPGGAGWRLVLGEEVAEAFAESDPALLRAELVQVAAVAVAWIEDIDSRESANAEPDEPVRHAEQLTPQGRPTGHALCDRADGSFAGAPLVTNAGMATCEACVAILEGDAPHPDEDDDPCDICANGGEDCGNCDGSGEDMYGGTDEGCENCDGTGQRIPAHCCACGGSPYCQCCGKCGASSVGACRCPIPVQMSDGTTRTV